MKREKKKKSPTRKIYEDLRECTFKPKINKASERLAKNRVALEEERSREKEAMNITNTKSGSILCL